MSSTFQSMLKLLQHFETFLSILGPKEEFDMALNSEISTPALQSAR